MRQAISTKYHGPTDHRGARVRASANAGSITIPWDYELDVPANHEAAARALALKLGWIGRWFGGGLADGYVFVTEDNPIEVYPPNDRTPSGRDWKIKAP